MAESGSHVSIAEGVSMGQGEFKGAKSDIEFFKGARNDAQECWVIGEKGYQPGNGGNLTADDINLLLENILSGGDSIQQIVPITGHNGMLGQAIIIKNRSTPPDGS